MKLRATIIESPVPDENTMVLQFEGDEKKQHFQVKCSFKPWNRRLRKWDYIEAVIKFESEIFEDPKTGGRSYFTHLTCNKAKEIFTPYGED